MYGETVLLVAVREMRLGNRMEKRTNIQHFTKLCKPTISREFQQNVMEFLKNGAKVTYRENMESCTENLVDIEKRCS